MTMTNPLAPGVQKAEAVAAVAADPAVVAAAAAAVATINIASFFIFYCLKQIIYN